MSTPRLFVTAAATAILAAGALAASAPADHAWAPSLPVPGTWQGTITVAGDEIAYVGADNISEAAAQRSVLLRTDDQGRTWTPRTPPATAFTRYGAAGDTIVGMGPFLVAVSTNGGLVWSYPDALQPGLSRFDPGSVAVDDDGSVWLSYRSRRGCATPEDLEVRVTDDLGATASVVGLPEGWSPRDMTPGPGDLVLARAVRCDDGAGAVFLSHDDGATWRRVPGIDATSSSVPAAWVGPTTAVVPTDGSELAVLTDIGAPTGPTVELRRLSDTTPLGTPNRVEDVDTTDDQVAVTTSGGLVRVAALVDGRLGAFRRHHDGTGLGLQNLVGLFPDGSMLARVEHHVVERTLD